MGRELWSTLTFLLLSATLVGATPPGFWDISIDTDPAPAPEDGPPLSAHATRNRALLPAQICGIVGAYILTVLLLGGLLLTVGKRLRFEAQQGGKRLLEVEMVKTAATMYDPSPTSPSSTTRAWMRSSHRFGIKRNSRKSFASVQSNPSNGNLGSPDRVMNDTFDATVIEKDKAERQKEMERLYAAVMEHDSKSSASVVCSVPEEESRPETAGTVLDIAAQSPPRDKRLLRIMTDAAGMSKFQAPGNQAGPASPNSPRSPIRFIYPPGNSLSSDPTTPTSPITARYSVQPTTPTYPLAVTNLYPATAKQAQVYANPPSPRSARQSHASSTGSSTSTPRTRRALRNLYISPPIRKHGDDDDDQQISLTPRHYSDVPAPPSPPAHPPKPHTGQPAIPDPPDTGVTIIEDDASDSGDTYTTFDKPRPLFIPASQRGAWHHPADPPTQSSSPAKSATSTTSTLPLRAFLSASPSTTAPPSATKTTYLSRRRDLFCGPRTGATPTTGHVPMTPYSPYMPFTPITPVTPYLVGRRERRERERREARRVLCEEEDRVQEEGEMWGVAY